ncbi:hypothetical protein N836_13650 [Leptolyngbya sp. Heron Island J]|uniref:hypothetical protein n=1 Tax=Leptolyngbya sp. Heron Island J TaxID=1385935 RepID=UPI0003B9A380|nr:hypothetical protein [Leptolyngbya sp. Heron Island J]ESA35104.1 hypothetical protein N836_13650 [Leptolyngbya sp. Heron Island J]
MSEDRLTRIETSIEELVKAVAITNDSVKSLRTEVSETSATVKEVAQTATETNRSVQQLRADMAKALEGSTSYTDASFGAVVQAMDERDSEVRAEQKKTEALLQNLIDDARTDRKANKDALTAFQESFLQLVTQISARLNEIWTEVQQMRDAS